MNAKHFYIIFKVSIFEAGTMKTIVTMVQSIFENNT